MIAMIHSIWRRGLLASLIAILSFANVGANSSPPDSCPLILIRCSSREGCCCQRRTFAVDISGGYVDKNPTYKWSISAGKIAKGQGTSEIKVDASGVT
jgi:hypothetical protein